MDLVRGWATLMLTSAGGKAHKKRVSLCTAGFVLLLNKVFLHSSSQELMVSGLQLDWAVGCHSSPCPAAPCTHRYGDLRTLTAPEGLPLLYQSTQDIKVLQEAPRHNSSPAPEASLAMALVLLQHQGGKSCKSLRNGKCLPAALTGLKIHWEKPS